MEINGHTSYPIWKGSNTQIEKLQRLENRVWRYLLGIGGYSTIESLRGEMGASMVKSRVMETMHWTL